MLLFSAMEAPKSEVEHHLPVLHSCAPIPEIVKALFQSSAWMQKVNDRELSTWDYPRKSRTRHQKKVLEKAEEAMDHRLVDGSWSMLLPLHISHAIDLSILTWNLW